MLAPELPAASSRLSCATLNRWGGGPTPRTRKWGGPPQENRTSCWRPVGSTRRPSVADLIVGEAEPARALGQDTLPRCRRVLGPEHPITQNLTQGMRTGHLLPLPEEGAAEDHPSRPL